MKININTDEVKSILEMHSKLKKPIIKEQINQTPSSTELPATNPDEAIIRKAVASGCLTNGKILRKKSTNQIFYRKNSVQEPTKQVDFFTDMTYKFTDGSKNGKWKCPEVTNLKPKTDSTQANVQATSGTLNQEQKDFIDKWTTQGYIYNPSRLEQVDKVSVDVVSLGAPAGLFPKGTVLWYDPNKQKDISRKDDSILDDILDNQSINRQSCKKNIEDFYKAFQTRKSVVIDPAKLDQSKRIVQACKDQHYGNWGILGGGKKWDNILDILSGKVSGGTPSSSPYRLQ
jgi:hypothetical protein